MGSTRKYQRAFGRSAQTKILDAVWNRRAAGINVKEISAIIGVSYYYAVIMLPRLESRGLIVRERRGRESIIRPNTKSPIVRAISRWRR
ncbi:MAG: hypothetical protein HY556_10585 [Euryarchaeota archaeon]|nr:hypothetical protein [Euryarchaeota archaeon]